MFSKTVVLVLALCSVALADFPALTEEKVTEIRGKLAELIESSAAPQGPQFLTFIPGFVRLSFHDCVGKCDGCVNLDNADNAGLEMYIAPLQRVYDANNYGDVLSVADFWALAGVVAVEMGAEKAGQELSLPFEWGRTDCPTAPSTGEVKTFPNAAAGLVHILDFFQNEFGFDAREVTALMGAHTLGRAAPANSGYRGPWVPRQDQLDNEYYRDLENPNFSWNQRNVARPGSTQKWQWERPNANGGQFMMLNTDMCLVKNIAVDVQGQSTVCTVASDCSEQQETGDIVSEYANDNSQWLNDFEAVFIKMINHANGNLQIPQPEVIPTTPAPVVVPGPAPGGRRPPPPGRGPPGRGRSRPSRLMEALRDLLEEVDRKNKN